MYFPGFTPEGTLIHTQKNDAHLSSLEALRLAMENRTIIEGEVVMCDREHNLLVNLGDYQAVIPHNDAASGIAEGFVREIAIISRVGKPISFTIESIQENDKKISIRLSRRKAQELALNHIIKKHIPGDVISAKVTHIEPFGIFVDIGCGNVSFIGIESLSVSRIAHPKDRFHIGDDIHAVITSIDPSKKRLSLSHRELLGTWKENADLFNIGETVRGIVRGIEDYGIFIELTPNLSGLAERRDDISVGDTVSVFIKNIIPEKMKIKLVVIDVFHESFNRFITKNDYFITDGHIERWQYSPEDCSKKKIISEFQSQE